MTNSPFEWTAVRALHPQQVVTLAAINGFSAPSVGGARILVHGVEDCGDLVPLASYLRGAEIVAVDTSAERLTCARVHFDELGVKGVELHERTQEEGIDDLGQFDYILARGATKRLGASARRRLIAACAAALSPMGFLVLGYNALPGWGPMAQLGSWLRRRLTGVEGDEERAVRARELVHAFRPADGADVEPVMAGLTSAATALWSMEDSEILEDVLDPRVQGVTLSQIAAAAESAGLSYVGDTQRDPARAQLRRRLAAKLGDDAGTALDLDELCDLSLPRLRRFSVFTRPKKQLQPGALLIDLDGRFIAARLVPKGGELDLNSETSAFEGPFGVSMEVESRLLRAALGLLAGVWPRPVPIALIVQEAANALARANPLWAAEVVQSEINETKARLLHLCEVGLADLSTEPPDVTDTVSARPRAHDLVKYQARGGRWVTSPLHQDVELSPFLAALVRLLDGEHDGLEIEQALSEGMSAGEFRLDLQGKVPTDEVSQRLVLRSFVMQGLENLREAALLARRGSEKQ